MSDHEIRTGTLEVRNTAVDELLELLDAGHLSDDLRAVAQPVCDLGHALADTLGGREFAAGLRKLIEAKDCFVRAAIIMQKEPT